MKKKMDQQIKLNKTMHAKSPIIVQNTFCPNNTKEKNMYCAFLSPSVENCFRICECENGFYRIENECTEE